jgi:L-malate glycosyltransferase
MRAASVLAHPSLEESFGMIVLEAMATGTPVVAGRASGAVPWLLANDAGVLVDVRNSAAIAEAINGLLGDPELSAKKGMLANLRASAEFRSEYLAKQYLHALSDTMLDPR